MVVQVEVVLIKVIQIASISPDQVGGSGNTPPVSPPQGNNGGGSANQALLGGGGGGRCYSSFPGTPGPTSGQARLLVLL